MSQTKTESNEQQVGIETFFEAETYSPYAMRNVVNKILKAIDKDAKELPGPMFYNYVNKGYIVADENKKVTKANAIEWTNKYLAKRFAAQTTEV